MHRFSGLQIHIILLGLWLAGWPLVWISVDCLKHVPKWLFHSPHLCQPLLSTDKIRQWISFIFPLLHFKNLHFSSLLLPFSLEGHNVPSAFRGQLFFVHLWPSPSRIPHCVASSVSHFSGKFGLFQGLQLCSVPANISRSSFVPNPNLICFLKTINNIFLSTCSGGKFSLVYESPWRLFSTLQASIGPVYNEHRGMFAFPLVPDTSSHPPPQRPLLSPVTYVLSLYVFLGIILRAPKSPGLIGNIGNYMQPLNDNIHL